MITSKMIEETTGLNLNNFKKSPEQSLISNIIKTRKSLNLSQKELAILSNMTQQEISRIEKMHHSPNLCTLYKILDGLECDLFLEKKDKLKENSSIDNFKNYCEWISITKRLPEEKEDPYTKDFLSYECTFKSNDLLDVRYYKFGNGHWWNGGKCMDQYVIAWRERPLPYVKN